jgi:hypothetical protein
MNEVCDEERTRYVKRVVFSTDDTAVPVQIIWPDPLTRQELSELKEFIDIWMRGLERRAHP